jgi:hypothetical protein
MSDTRASKFSRRAVMAMGAVSGVGALAVLGGVASVDEAAAAADSGLALAALRRGITYLGIDGLDFWPIVASERLYEDITGVKLSSSGRLFAPLLLPVGSAVVEISASYQTQPIIEISKRPLFSGTPGTAPVQVFQKSMQISPGGPFASTEQISPAVVLAANATYLVSAFLTPGSAIFGVRVGYRPPTQSFLPFTGANHRFLNTQASGGKLVPGVTRTVQTGLSGARSAVFNLNVAAPAGNGSIACFPGGGAVSTTPVIRYSAGETIQNLVIARIASNGTLSFRASGASTHAFADLIGFLI